MTARTMEQGGAGLNSDFSDPSLTVSTEALRAVLLFLVCSKVVVEQYLLWPLALLAVRMIARRSPASAALLVLLSATGMLVNPYIHPFGREPAALDGGLALVVLGFVVTTLRGVPWAARVPPAA